jgi:hypothetical protein
MSKRAPRTVAEERSDVLAFLQEITEWLFPWGEARRVIRTTASAINRRKHVGASAKAWDQRVKRRAAGKERRSW